MADTQNVSTPATQAATKAEADAQRRSELQTKASADGAASVAEAVKRVADAAVEEARKVRAVQAGDFDAAGIAGGKLQIRARDNRSFGASGSVFLNGAALRIHGWGASHIEAYLPADARSGELVVWVDPETQRRAYLTL